MESPNKTLRKVRFTLPENENNFAALIASRNSSAVQVKQQPNLPPIPVDDTKVHGTSRYVNGTLNFAQDDFNAVFQINANKPKIENNKVAEPIKFLRPCIKQPRKPREPNKRSVVAENEIPSSTFKSLPLPSSLSKRFHYFIRSKSESHGKKKDVSGRSRKANVMQSYAAFYFPGNEPTRTNQKRKVTQKTPTTSTTNDVKIPNMQSLRIDDDETIPATSTKTQCQLFPHMKSVLVDGDENLKNFSQFFDRWCVLQLAANKKLSNIQSSQNRSKLNNKSSVQKKLFKLADVKSSASLTSSFRKRIMNIQKTPLVTSLLASALRASKDGNMEELVPVIRTIVENGITKTDLNAVDKNGRTALSYISVTSLTNALDFLLRLPGIDVNKADNDGNTPLHYAAEAGQSEVITMLTSRSRSLVIDSKNNLGLTPLMKAAIQGRIDCAKRLMLASASPFEVDSRRGYTTVQWALLCGRTFCADSMSQIIRINLSKTTCVSNKTISRKVVSRTPSAIISNNKASTGGLTSKFLSALSFSKKRLDLDGDLPDLVNIHNKYDKHCKDGRTTEKALPKIQIFFADNHSLIEKYSNRYEYDATNVKSDVEPPSRKTSRGEIMY